MTLEGLRVIVDCAHGAAYKSTPCILRELGADITVAHDTPNGTNINADCGSTHPEEIRRVVKESGAHVGITHDGDADRVLLCDENGELVDGDEILAIASVDLLLAKKLRDSTLVATVMSNFGLDETLGAHGGKVIRTKVGDRYVLEEMMARNLNVGGEQSGHMIFRDFTTTGDGIISALQVLRIMKESGKPLSELKRCLKKYPQAQRNLRVKRKPPLEELPAVMKLVPPLPGEEALYKWIGSVLEAAAKDPEIKKTLKETAIAAERELIDPYFQWRNNGRLAGNGWNSPVNGAKWGTDYANRTGTAKSNMYDNLPEETKYIYTDDDSQGKQLDGRNLYTVTFAKGQTPPVKGFWSLTLYNDVHFFNTNPLNRYSLGTKNKTLKYNPDGSLTLYAGARSPGKDKESNWLPAPNGPAYVVMRLYWPKDAAFNGSWKPPAVQRQK